MSEYSANKAPAASDSVHACNCIGPQDGEKLCPCALRAAKGLVVTTSEPLIDQHDTAALKELFSDDRPWQKLLKLTPTQRSVMALVALGYTNVEVGTALGVTKNVVRNHVNRIFKRLGVRNRVEAVLMWNKIPFQRPEKT